MGVETDSAGYVNGTSPEGGKPKCADLFCGPGAFSLAAHNHGLEVAYAYEPDEEARMAYKANFGITPHAYIGEGFTEENLPPDTLDLLFCRFPESEAGV